MDENSRDLLKNFRESLNALYKAAECPVCLEVITAAGGSRLCTLGHGVCSPCADKLDSCPLCRKPLSNKNLILVNNLLEALPKFCRYSVTGCPEVLENQAMDVHERFCRFQEMECLKCYQRVVTCKMLEHFEDMHPHCWVVTGKYFEFKIYNLNRDYYYFIKPISLFGKTFFLRIKYDRKTNFLNVSFLALPDVKDEEFYVRVTLERWNFVYTHEVKAIQSAYQFQFNPAIDSFMYLDREDGDIRKVECMQKYCFKVPKKTLLKCADHRGSICLKFNFFHK